MAFLWTIWWLGCLLFGFAPLARSTTESTTTTAPQTTQEKPAVDLGALLDAGEGAVVTLVAGDTRLVAHRAVLAARSPVFEAMLSNNSLEASSRQVVVQDMEGPVLRQLVAYLYSFQDPQVSSTAPQLLAAADTYGVSGLKAACERQLVAQLAVGNAASSASLAVRHSCPRLKEAAVAFIRNNFFAVMATHGWAHETLSHTKDMVVVMQLLAETLAGTSAPAAADGGSAPGQTRSGSSQTPAASTPAPPACNAPLPDDHTVSQYRSLPADEKARRLVEAAKEGAADEVRALLAAGADVGASGEDKPTALHCAAAGGHEAAARRLLLSGAEVDARDRRQLTPLHFAAHRGHVAVARLLLVAGADANARNERLLTPLHFAAKEGHAALVRLLAVAGANVDTGTDIGWTPLHWAAWQGHAEAAAALLAAGANKGAETSEGSSPRSLASRKGHGSIVELLN